MPWELVMSAPSPVAVTDGCGEILRANKAFCSLVGADETKVVGSQIGAFLDPPDLIEDQARTRCLLAGEADSCRFEQRYRRADGTTAAVRCYMWPAPERGDAPQSPRPLLRLLHPLVGQERFAATPAAAVVAATVDAITAYSLDGTIIQWNPAAEELYGLASERVVGRLAADVLPSEWASDVEKILQQVAAGQRAHEHETTRPRGDGTTVEVSLSIAPLTDDRHEITGAAVVARDITRRKRAESLLTGQTRVLELIAAGAELRHILDALAELIEAHARSTRCSILLLDQDSPGRLCHGGGVELPGIEDLVEEDLGQSPPGGAYGTAAMIVADLATDSRCESWRHLALGLGLRRCWASPIVASGSGSIVGVFALYYPELYRPDDDDWALLARLTHVASLAISRHLSMNQLAHQAIHDPLTGAANRTLVRDRLAQAMERLKRARSSVGVLFLDLDGFKGLNDSYGHDAGDNVLVELARRLQMAVRPTDTVARIGGDEFVVLCEGVVGEVEVIGIADRISHAVAAPFIIGDNEVPLSASIGIALPRGDETPESLIQQADAAMYRAKERGKARYQLFDTAMHERALGRLQTERALRKALREDELKLMYQPLVELERETIVAVEALLRWERPDRGLLGPTEFLDVAEGTGLIVPIGAWVIQEACRQAARWSKAGATAATRIHVNVSARQLFVPGLPEVVRSALAESGAMASAICLEITESVLIRNPSDALGILQALKSLGVRLSIDDFGTGYSSLAYVNSFPIDELKIDRSFIAQLRKDERHPIVHSVISLAHALDLTVVAEGVETVEQADQLRKMGCDTAQGYYWSRPLSPESVPHLHEGHGWHQAHLDVPEETP